MEAIASGPFSLGPAAFGSSARARFGGGGSGAGAGAGAGGTGSSAARSTTGSNAITGGNGGDSFMDIDGEGEDMKFGDGTNPWAPVSLPNMPAEGKRDAMYVKKEKGKGITNRRAKTLDEMVTDEEIKGKPKNS